MPLKIDDEAEYAEAVRELSTGVLREGLWAKSLVEADGDRERAKLIYLRYRVALIKEEKKEAVEARRRQEAATAEEEKTRQSLSS